MICKLAVFVALVAGSVEAGGSFNNHSGSSMWIGCRPGQSSCVPSCGSSGSSLSSGWCGGSSCADQFNMEDGYDGKKITEVPVPLEDEKLTADATAPVFEEATEGKPADFAKWKAFTLKSGKLGEAAPTGMIIGFKIGEVKYRITTKDFNAEFLKKNKVTSLLVLGDAAASATPAGSAAAAASGVADTSASSSGAEPSEAPGGNSGMIIVVVIVVLIVVAVVGFSMMGGSEGSEDDEEDEAEEDA